MAQRYTIKDKDWSPKDEKDILYYRNVAARLEAIVDSQLDCVKIVTRDYKLMEMNVTGLKMIDVEHIDKIRGRVVFWVLWIQNIKKPIRKALMIPMKVKTQMLNLRLLD